MTRIRSHLLLPLVLVALAACTTDDRFTNKKHGPGDFDAGPSKDSGSTDLPNVCELSKCPKPETGLSCCTPLAQCGTDPTGIGLACVPNPGGNASEMVCDLGDCPKPTVGIACCTPFAQCGNDPFSSGLACFANPAVSVVPSGEDGGQCDADQCPTTDDGPAACCLPNGECGVDSWGIGICFLPPPVIEPVEPVDAAVPPVSTEPPDDPSVTGECPSYLGFYGPIWGCCSDYGVCGTFTSDECLLPVGTQIPVASDEDAGAPVYPYCKPPTKKK